MLQCAECIGEQDAHTPCICAGVPGTKSTITTCPDPLWATRTPTRGVSKACDRGLQYAKHAKRVRHVERDLQTRVICSIRHSVYHTHFVHHTHTHPQGVESLQSGAELSETCQMTSTQSQPEICDKRPCKKTSVCLYVCMSVCLYVCMSVCLHVKRDPAYPPALHP